MAATTQATPAGDATPAAGVPGASTATSSANSSKNATPQPSTETSLPHRDKEYFKKVLLTQFITNDALQGSAMCLAQQRLESLADDMHKEINDYKKVRSEFRHYFPPSSLYGPGYSGYGNGYTDFGGPSRIVYPAQKWATRPGKRTTPPLKYTKKDNEKQAEQHEELVPVRLEVEWDKIKLRDTLTWNLHDRLVMPELFAAQLVEDMGLKPPVDRPVYDQVLAQIQEQLNDFYPFAYSEEDALDPELPYSAYKNDEMRILVKLNITIGTHTLVDQFEWEMNNPLNSPEEFAATMARDLALSGEFTTAIAHCIREQTQLFTRSLYSIGHPFDGRPIEDPDLVSAFLPSPLPSVFRPQQQAKEYAPFLYELTEGDLERNETIFSREQRRQKRSVNRRGGPQLPDLKERQRTIRTLVVSSVIPGAATDIEDSRLYKRALGGLGRGKRAARDGDLSDSEESDESAPDSPAISQMQGTARTRGMRGAANAATQRMANIGRSETPEATIHHHETRTARRFGRETTREETEEEPARLIVTLNITPAKLKKLFRDLKSRPTAGSGPGTPSVQNAPGAMGPPPSTPSTSTQNLPSQAQLDRVPAPPPPPPGERPPLPVRNPLPNSLPLLPHLFRGTPELKITHLLT
jgi:SWI/SNF-related matrix-associated actin-dependent regulator of chromatin subfamily B protein 1